MHVNTAGMVKWVIPSNRVTNIDSLVKHNLNGPALCFFDRYGKLKNNSCEFWVNGKRLRYKKFKEEYLIIHLREYPYGPNELAPEVLQQCKDTLDRAMKPYRSS